MDEDGFETEIPVVSLDVLRTPRHHDGISWQETGMSHLIPVNLDALDDPTDYHTLLSGDPIDRSPTPLNGIFYPDNPNNDQTWSEITNENTPGERQVLKQLLILFIIPQAIVLWKILRKCMQILMRFKPFLIIVLL